MSLLVPVNYHEGVRQGAYWYVCISADVLTDMVLEEICWKLFMIYFQCSFQLLSLKVVLPFFQMVPQDQFLIY